MTPPYRALYGTHMDTFTHITKDFQRWTKAQQADHLREHGVPEADIAQGLRTQSSRTPAAMSLYQQHITAHEAGA